MVWHTTSDCTTSTITANSVIIDASGWGSPTPDKPEDPGPETALAWLDRRVDEIRLEL